MEAAAPRDIVCALEIGKFDKVAAQLAALCDLADDEEQIIDLRSLQKFTLFVTREQIPTLEIGINPDGFMQSIWKIRDYGSLAMDFLPSGDVVFSILFYQHEPGFQQQQVSGRVSLHRVMCYISEFVGRSATQ